MKNPVEPAVGGMEWVSLRLTGGEAAPRRGEPVTLGVPFPRGVLRDVASLSLHNSNDDTAHLPLQARVTDHWADGSVRWALIDWLADSTASYRLMLRHTTPAARAVAPTGIALQERAGCVTIDTGASRFTIDRSAPGFPFASVETGGKPVIDPARSTLAIEGETGQRYEPTIDEVTVEERGPVRVAVRLWGRVASTSREPICHFIARVECFAGSPTVRLTLTLTNPRPAGHPDGKWDLGNSGSIYLRHATLTLAPAAHASGEPVIRFSPEIGGAWTDAGTTLEIYQDSSGGENWKSTNHLNRKHEVPHAFQGYRVVTPTGETRGLRATPIVTIERGGNRLAATTPWFWQNFPKAINADANGLSIGLFPRQFSDVHEIQGGEQKTHTLHLSYGADGVTESPLEWGRRPLIPALDPSWACRAEAMPYLLPRSQDPNADHAALVDAALEGADTFEKKREVIDEYGWRHFGDIYGDHEAVFDKGEHPLVSHYNNQYDAVRGFGVQFLRTGDPRWRHAMDELASHVIDIDLYHTDGDKAAYNHGLFWHTCHYIDADTGTHRSYPSRKKVPGGGPSGGHLYTTGLMLHHFLTGDPLSRESAVSLAQYVIDADDGNKTILRFLSRANTGHISCSGFVTYHGPGRAPANAVNALIDGHRLTGEKRFLDKAEQIIRRAAHPSDDPAKMNLLDAENHWFYTMFLQSLGRYLDHKAQLGELDRMYAYARAILLRYTDWMAANEYPYLDKPEKLEYPTETWAAQDMRKSEVFKIASRHAEPSQREKFLERAEFFFRYSVNTLKGMPTRTLCRPVVLLLSYGNTHGCFQSGAVRPAPPPQGTFDFGSPTRFIPQKQQAKSRLKKLIVAGGALGMAILLAGVYWLVMR